MEHDTPHARAVYMVTGLIREMSEVRTGSSSMNFFQAVSTREVTSDH